MTYFEGETRFDFVTITGRVLDAGGVPVAGALVEIKRCDNDGCRAGSYNASPGSSADSGRHSVIRIGADGRYAWRTPSPVLAPDRIAQVQVRVNVPGVRELLTRFRLKGQPLEQRDFVFPPPWPYRRGVA